VRNPQAEALLDELGLQWHLDLIKLDDIDRERSLANQARFAPLSDELLERYERSERAGAVFPAIIVGENGKAKYVVADGNHRSEVGRRIATRELIWSYVFQYGSDSEFQNVAYMANARLNGQQNSLEERVAHAAHFVARGVPIAEAAVLLGVTARQISIYRSAQRARQRFEELKINPSTYAAISDNTIVDISGACADDSLRHALRLLNNGVAISKIVYAARDAGSTFRTEHERASAQIAAFERLTKRNEKTTAAALAQQPQRKDMLEVRLKGCLDAIQRALDLAPKYDEYLAEIKELICA
jgi:hypothetical protein